MEPSGTEIRKLSIQEEGFVHVESTARPQWVKGLVMMNGAVDEASLLGRLEQFVSDHPLFASRICRSSLSWVRDFKFDLSQHVTSCSVSSEDQMLDDWEDPSVDDRLPPWRMQLIHLQREGATRSALRLNAHHALLDGLVAVDLLGYLAGRVRSQGSVKPSSRTMWDLARGMMRSAWVAQRDLLRRRPPVRGLSHDRTTERQVVLHHWSRNAIREKAKARNATTQECVLLLASEFLGDLPEFFAARSARAILPLGRVAESGLAGDTNRHDVGFVQLPLGDQQDRLASIQRELGRLLRHRDLQVFPDAQRLMGLMPTAIRRFVFRHWASRANALISFLPTGNAKQLLGAEIDRIYAIPALPAGHTLTLGFMVGKKTVTGTVKLDRNTGLSDEQIRASLERAWNRI